MLAVFNGNLKCVKLLVNREFRMKNKEGQTALMLTMISGHLECAK